jgi:hypothetical protein
MARAQQLPVSLAAYPDDAIVGADVVARALGVSPRQIGRLKDLSFIDVSPRCRRYRVGDVRAWIVARTRRRTAVA